MAATTNAHAAAMPTRRTTPAPLSRPRHSPSTPQGVARPPSAARGPITLDLSGPPASAHAWLRCRMATRFQGSGRVDGRGTASVRNPGQLHHRASARQARTVGLREQEGGAPSSEGRGVAARAANRGRARERVRPRRNQGRSGGHRRGGSLRGPARSPIRRTRVYTYVYLIAVICICRRVGLDLKPMQRHLPYLFQRPPIRDLPVPTSRSNGDPKRR
jgi:hypothetical protein